MSRLSNYIKNIDAEKPINLNAFYKLVDSLRLTNTREPKDVIATKHKGQLYIVTRINNELLSELRTLVADKGSSRAAAATQNKSHSVNVSGSFLLIRNKSAKPVVVMINADGEHHSPIPLSAEALVLENRQNFIDAEQMVDFLETHTVFRLTPKMNIIFSEGNEISNALHKKFLSQYERLHLCMDVDLGGLTIARNLMSLLPETQFNFLVPDDIAERLDKIVEREQAGYIDEVIKIGLSTPALAPAAKLIKDKQKTLEQESYLHE